MIYRNEARAREVAAELNQRKGYAPAYAISTAEGWTVVSSYRRPAQVDRDEAARALGYSSAAEKDYVDNVVDR
jgi:hypothetical protein